MNMHSIAWWPILTLLAIATVVDIHSRRIPNWLVLPFLAAGVVANTAAGDVRISSTAWRKERPSVRMRKSITLPPAPQPRQ